MNLTKKLESKISSSSYDEINPKIQGGAKHEDDGEQIGDYIKYNNTCIKDLNTNSYWYIAPDQSFSFEEAENFARNTNERNLNWRIPTFEEIRNLYNPEY